MPTLGKYIDWEWNSSSHPISDLRDWNRREKLEIRPDFQRKEIWSNVARIMLIDSILKNIPIPKIYFKSVVSEEEETHRIVIDGQQRIRAILSFLEDGFLLEYPYQGPYYGKKYSELPPRIKKNILSYKIDVNEIVNAPDEIIRDIYHRVNKFSISLTKQELRRADYPGDFLDLSEDLSAIDFFSEMKIFTIANSRRMGDVEYVSELLALLIDGPQEKRKSLDTFYLDYSEWNKKKQAKIRKLFESTISTINELLVKRIDTYAPFMFSKSRFKQRADFYALFAAVGDCLTKYKSSIKDLNLTSLQSDFYILDEKIEPSSEIDLFRSYAVKCVSQANSKSSRVWRRNFLKMFIESAFSRKPPELEVVKIFHKLKWQMLIEYNECVDYGCPPSCATCPICEKDDIDDCSTENVTIAWYKEESTFNLSNCFFVHKECLTKVSNIVHWKYEVDSPLYNEG